MQASVYLAVSSYVGILIPSSLAQRSVSPIIVAALAERDYGDCACQCSSLQFVDSRGFKHGNCWSTFNEARWCYVKYDGYSPCIDVQESKRFPGKYWSYHACATPAANSPSCGHILPPPLNLSPSSPPLNLSPSSSSHEIPNILDNVY